MLMGGCFFDLVHTVEEGLCKHRDTHTLACCLGGNGTIDASRRNGIEVGEWQLPGDSRAHRDGAASSASVAFAGIA